MTEDQVFVRKTRSEPDLPLLDTAPEDIAGEHVWKGVMAEMREALGDSLTSAAMMGAQMNLGLTGSRPRPPTRFCGWPTYLIHNATASLRRPISSSHRPLFPPCTSATRSSSARHQQHRFWFANPRLLVDCGRVRGGGAHYGVPYLGGGHSLVLLIFLQHAHARLPHYSGAVFTFPRSAFSIQLRSLAAPSRTSSQGRTSSTITRGTPRVPFRTHLAATGLTTARGAGGLHHHHPDHPRLQGQYHASRSHLPDMLWSDFFLPTSWKTRVMSCSIWMLVVVLPARPFIPRAPYPTLVPLSMNGISASARWCLKIEQNSTTH